MKKLTIICPKDANTEAGANRVGAFTIKWKVDEQGEASACVLHEQGPLGGKTLYRGAARATVVTGRPRGDYRYQVKLAGSERWSEACLVKVRPYAGSTALAFFATGFLITALTVAVVILGHRAHRRGKLG